MNNQEAKISQMALMGLCGIALVLVSYFLPSILDKSMSELSASKFHKGVLTSVNYAFLLPLSGVLALAAFVAGKKQIIGNSFAIAVALLGAGVALYSWMAIEFYQKYSHVSFQSFWYVCPLGLSLAGVGLWGESRSDSKQVGKN